MCDCVPSRFAQVQPEDMMDVGDVFFEGGVAGAKKQFGKVMWSVVYDVEHSQVCPCRDLNFTE